MKKSKKNKTIYIVIILVLFITIGYAFLNANLSINGTTYIEGNTWDIHFDNLEVSDGSVSLSQGNSAAEIDDNDTTTVNFSVTLNLPGDYYEFTVDAVNDGSVDGMIEEITTTLNSSEVFTLPPYLEYSFSYSNGDPLEESQALEADTSESIKVKVKFKDNIDVDDLPETAQVFNFSFSIKYMQSDDNVVPAHS